MKSVVALYGQDTLIQFEDFGKNNAFRWDSSVRSHWPLDVFQIAGEVPGQILHL